MDRIRRDTLLGLVFFGTMAFLLWATVNLTDISLHGSQLEVWFEDGGSVDVGTNVMVLGKKVGKVTAIDVDYARQERPVKLTLQLREEVPMTGEYTIEVRDAGVLGGKMIYIDPRRGPRHVGRELLGDVKGNAFERLGDIADGKGALGKELLEAVAEITRFARSLNQEDSTIGQLTQSKALHVSLLSASDRFNEILQAVIDGKGTIGQLVMNQDSGERVNRLVQNLAKVSDQLLDAEAGPLGMLINDRVVAADLHSVAENLAVMIADARGGKGVVGQLLRNDTLAGDFGNAVAKLSELLTKANDPDAGAIGALTSDRETGKDLKLMLANLRQVTDQLTRNEGLFGMLINDKDLGVRFRRIMNQVSRAIEDAREAAPIGNFVQVLLGAF